MRVAYNDAIISGHSKIECKLKERGESVLLSSMLTTTCLLSSKISISYQSPETEPS